MESRFYEVHPLKSSSSNLLPAKKRMKCLDLNSSPETPLEYQTSSSVCLPAKKKVWAIQPISPEKPIQQFDLNLDYQQSPEKTHKKICFYEPKSGEQEVNNGVTEEEINGEEGFEEEEDDGIVCDVCKSTDGDPSDPIVLCDGCDLMVHSTCYGNPLIQAIPEGDWFCCTCQASINEKCSKDDEEKSSLYCCLCPIKGGALKPTTDNRWAHITCALLVPEVFFKDPKGREDVDCSRVPSKRFQEVCYVCKSKNGCVIQCSELNCDLAFHVTCGLKQELSIEFKQGRNSRKGGIVAGFCKPHSELWEKEQQTGKYKIVPRDADRK